MLKILKKSSKLSKMSKSSKFAFFHFFEKSFWRTQKVVEIPQLIPRKIPNKCDQVRALLVIFPYDSDHKPFGTTVAYT